MKRTTLETFREELLATGSYSTPPERRAAKRRSKGWWTTVSFTWAPFSVFPKCAVAEALRYLDTELWARYCFESVRTAEAFGMEVRMDGWENAKGLEGRPAVFVSNHMSTLETILLPPVLLTYGPFSVFVKASLSHLPFLSRAAVHMGLIPLGRKSPREDLMTALTDGVNRLKAGNSALIFPQGRREEVFRRAHYSSIGAKLAERAGVPLVPIAVKTDCEPVRPGGKGWFKDFGTVDPSKDIFVRCGPPLTGKSRDIQSQAFEWTADALESWSMPVER